MASAPAAKANAAFVDEDYDLALALYKQAIDASPNDPSLYSQRAQTLIKLENYLEAAEDAGKAIELDPKTGRHHHRKGVALFNLEEYESAKSAFEAGQALDPRNSTFKTWVRKCAAEMDDEVEEIQTGTHEPAKPSSTNGFPSSAVPPPVSQAASTSTAPSVLHGSPSGDEPSMPPPVDPNQPKYRHQWFQTQSVVEVAVLAKSMTKERVDIHIDQHHLRVVIRDAEGQQEYELDVDLYGQVDPPASKHELLKSKTEIRLKKSDAIKWPTLEKSNQKADAYAKAPTAIPTPPVQQPKPAYPSSFNKKTVDWDKLESEIKKDEKDEKLEGDAALQKLFKDIYGGADEDTRRAMNKSFQESNGTVLSTNWKDIGKKPTECTPPTGMEAKKYGKE
ncbi:hypothetical protein WJX82_009900 [Trebouxia sp. C0006]